MMISAAHLLDIADNELGYVEGPGNNQTKYWADLQPSFQGESWCAAWVSWVYIHAGLPLPAVDHSWGYADTHSVINRVHANLSEGVALDKLLAGDVLCYWGGRHTGIFEHYALNGDLVTLEGNTSAGNSGSQTNGGGVYRRVRHRSDVTVAWRPYQLTQGDEQVALNDADKVFIDQAIEKWVEAKVGMTVLKKLDALAADVAAVKRKTGA
jgi:hypothetical protein